MRRGSGHDSSERWLVIADGPNAPVTGDAQIFAQLSLSDNECRDWKAVNSRRVNIR
jgi:hypothetical protein